MKDKEIEDLKNLAKTLKGKSLSKEQALTNLVNAGILNKDGNYTEPYKNLERMGKKTVKWNSDFIKELDVFAKEGWKHVFVAIEPISEIIYRIGFKVVVDEEFLKIYDLNSDIEFLVDTLATSGKMKYHYKGVEINPDGFYVTPPDFVEVTQLQILWEAIAQDTHMPNIKHLQSAKYYAEHMNDFINKK